ncbi:hypothetical protein [Nocardia sp. NPDC127526]|uniref:hypothetical protein n=1 Tax=Nocardia sp. NPDC127526 TaxID=3345393 RepID=UPI0036340A78
MNAVVPGQRQLVSPTPLSELAGHCDRTDTDLARRVAPPAVTPMSATSGSLWAISAAPVMDLALRDHVVASAVAR